MEYAYIYADITLHYINSIYLFSHQQNICAPLPLLESVKSKMALTSLQNIFVLTLYESLNIY